MTFRKSQPSWAAWIEITPHTSLTNLTGSQPSWAAWIEIFSYLALIITLMSQPSWAAWIEINAAIPGRRKEKVAALLGCVD